VRENAMDDENEETSFIGMKKYRTVIHSWITEGDFDDTFRSFYPRRES
jgi:hypothetical protein